MKYLSDNGMNGWCGSTLQKNNCLTSTGQLKCKSGQTVFLFRSGLQVLNSFAKWAVGQ